MLCCDSPVFSSFPVTLILIWRMGLEVSHQSLLKQNGTLPFLAALHGSRILLALSVHACFCGAPPAWLHRGKVSASQVWRGTGGSLPFMVSKPYEVSEKSLPVHSLPPPHHSSKGEDGKEEKLMKQSLTKGGKEKVIDCSS